MSANNTRTLYVLATPIGNLADISARALRVLQTANLLAAEDTRVAKRLLTALNIGAPKVLLSLREHNETMMSEKLCAAVGDGEHAVYICDAGTPAISDPGARLVQTARKIGLMISPIPGASALTALLSVTGITGGGVHFYGFPPRKKQAAFFQSLKTLDGCVVLFESPHRIAATIRSLGEALGGDRRAVLGRELTKLHEQIVDATLDELSDAVASGSIPTRGEFSLAVETPGLTESAVNAEQLFAELSRHLPPKQAARLAAKLTGADKSALYQAHTARPNATITDD